MRPSHIQNRASCRPGKYRTPEKHVWGIYRGSLESGLGLMLQIPRPSGVRMEAEAVEA